MRHALQRPSAAGCVACSWAVLHSPATPAHGACTCLCAILSSGRRQQHHFKHRSRRQGRLCEYLVYHQQGVTHCLIAAYPHRFLCDAQMPGTSHFSRQAQWHLLQQHTTPHLFHLRGCKKVRLMTSASTSRAMLWKRHMNDETKDSLPLAIT